MAVHLTLCMAALSLGFVTGGLWRLLLHTAFSFKVILLLWQQTPLAQHGQARSICHCMLFEHVGAWGVFAGTSG
jgi:hypothetical protein